MLGRGQEYSLGYLGQKGSRESSQQSQEGAAGGRQLQSEEVGSRDNPSMAFKYQATESHQELASIHATKAHFYFLKKMITQVQIMTW